MIPPRDSATDDHVGDLLPALINGTLDSRAAVAVREHLDCCAICSKELAEWQAIAAATRTFAARQETIVPALGDLWAEIDPGMHSRSTNGTLSHPAQARDAVRQGTADPSRRDRARQSRRTPMDTTTIPTTRPRFALPAWTRHLHGISTALLIAVIVALALAAWGLSGIGGNGDDDPNGNFAAISGSPAADRSTLGCTAEPMNRDEMIAHLQAANGATEPNHELYEQPREPSPAEAEAIVQTYREWQACNLLQNGGLQAMRFQTPGFTASTSGLFLDPSLSNSHRPISDEEIEAFVDGLLDETVPTPDAVEQTEIQPYPTASAGDSFTPTPVSGQGGMLPWYPTPALTPAATQDGTPTASGQSAPSEPTNPVAFGEDITLTGPDTASATARYIDERSGKELSIPPITFTFVKVDGQWLLDSYTDEAR